MFNILTALAIYITFEGLFVLVFTRASKKLANLMLGPYGNRRTAGLLAVAIGVTLFFFMPEEGSMAVVMALLGLPLLIYGLMVAGPGDKAVEQMLAAYNNYSKGQIKTLGLIELVVGSLMLLALVFYSSME